jgi:hypothetical protein
MSDLNFPPKLPIDTIGSFNNKGSPINWNFNGSNHPNSVGVYEDFEKGILLYGGYTAGELKEIALANIVFTQG